MHQTSMIAALTAALASVPSVQAGFYPKSSPVLELDARNFDSHVTNSNHTSIVEFYAPWCGHCQNLKPAYEKAAKNLEGLAKVVAVNCDEDVNKPLCGAQGVQGFPTLKTFRPGKKPGSKPVVEDYRGARTASGIAEEVANKINNHVTRVSDADIDAFIAKDGPEALLFTDKGTTSALLRGVAIDFLDVINVGQVRSKETKAVEKFGIEKFPTLVLIPADRDAEPVKYDGELKKKDIVEFLKQAGEPNPDPAPAKAGKKDKKEKKAKKDKKKDKSSSSSSSTKTAEPEEPTEEASEKPTEKSTAEQAAPSAPSIPPVSSYEQLVENCLNRKATTCLLVNVPAESSELADKAIAAVSELHAKHLQGQRHLFPFLSLPSDIEGVSSLRSALSLTNDVELFAVNAKRKWWKHYEGDFSVQSVEDWLDAIRLGDGEKKKLPKDVIAEVAETSTESSTEEATQATDAEPEVETEEKIEHSEL